MAMDHASLTRELESIDNAMMQAETGFSDLLNDVHPFHRMNAKNLLHYLVLRSRDIREMQESLHSCGLSSLASAESHIRGQLLEILKRLGRNESDPDDLCTYQKSKQSLKEKSAALFGNEASDGIPRIMVTFDTKFADDYGKIKGLLQSGMNIARINCAHDDESVWASMIQHIRRASAVTKIPCQVYMDLAGPKIRTELNHKKELKIKEGKKIYLIGSHSLNSDQGNLIGCSIQEIPSQLKPGETVLFDDGVIESKVERVEGKIAALRITRISSKKPRIKAGKGINFPDSNLSFPVLSKFDKKSIEFVRKNADIIGFSFVKDPADIDDLRAEMGDRKDIAMVLKIETPEAVRNLPQLLFRSMREKNIGVMIARGDLAVEIGFERMSEIQEEILWICEAAHLPVIWATQVLDNLNKSGLATRSEITDAAHAGYADCVMINKGKHVVRVLETLKDILARAGGHRIKKRYTFRPLGIATRFINN